MSRTHPPPPPPPPSHPHPPTPPFKQLSFANLPTIPSTCISQMCEKCSSSLRRISLRGCRGASHELIVRLVAICPGLVEFDLSYCGRDIGDDTIKALALTRPELEWLSLRCGAPGLKGAASIRLLLACCPSLRHLDLGEVHANILAGSNTVRHGIKLAGNSRTSVGSGARTLSQADVVARALCRVRPGTRFSPAAVMDSRSKVLERISTLPIYERVLLEAERRNKGVYQGQGGVSHSGRSLIPLDSPGPPAPPPSPPATPTISGLMHLSMAGLALSPLVAREVLMPGPTNGYAADGKSCKGQPWWHNLRSLDLSHCACLGADVLARLLVCSARPCARSEAAASYFPRLESLSAAHGLAPGEEMSCSDFDFAFRLDQERVGNTGTALTSIDLRFISLANVNTGDEVVASILGIEAGKEASSPAKSSGSGGDQLSEAELERRERGQRARGTARRARVTKADVARMKSSGVLEIRHFSCTWDLSHTAG